MRVFPPPCQALSQLSAAFAVACLFAFGHALAGSWFPDRVHPVAPAGQAWSPDPGPPGGAVSRLCNPLSSTPLPRGPSGHTWAVSAVSTADRTPRISQAPAGALGWNPAGSWLAAVQTPGTCWLHLPRDRALSRRRCGGRGRRVLTFGEHTC